MKAARCLCARRWIILSDDIRGAYRDQWATCGDGRSSDEREVKWCDGTRTPTVRYRCFKGAWTPFTKYLTYSSTVSYSGDSKCSHYFLFKFHLLPSKYDCKLFTKNVSSAVLPLGESLMHAKWMIIKASRKKSQTNWVSSRSLASEPCVREIRNFACRQPRDGKTANT